MGVGLPPTGTPRGLFRPVLLSRDPEAQLLRWEREEEGQRRPVARRPFGSRSVSVGSRSLLGVKGLASCQAESGNR